MEVLVTGGAGFIGSHLVTRLVERGHEVRVLDDLSSGSADIRNLEKVEDSIVFKVGSVSHLPTVQRICKGADLVIHLATQCLVMGIDDPAFLHEVNDVGTFNVCMAAKEHGLKVAYIGTSEEYGSQEVFPIKENAPLRPESLYALTKVVGEEYVKFFHETYGVPAVIIRPFNTFGSLQREDLDMERMMKGFNAYAGVITSFIKKFQVYESPVIFGDGHQMRDFTYVTDIAEGILLMSEKFEKCEVVNLGSDSEISILELGKLLAKIWGSPDPNFVYAPARPRDIRRLLADITLAKSHGYKPKVSFEEGLKKYVEWYRSASHRSKRFHR